jgi:molybdate transport system substrate-binding protein
MFERVSRRKILSATLAASCVAFAGCSNPAPVSEEPLKVAAASDLAVAFKEVGDAYEKKTGKKVSFSFGSTGLLSKQIKEGAPFDVFAAANVSYIDELAGAGAVLGDSKALYGRGRIVLYTPEGAEPVAKLADLSDAKFKKVAIANPEHAPYGKAAEQALTKAGVYAEVKAKLVPSENVLQALQYVDSGNAEVAIVALSLALTAKGKHTDIEESLHEPIDQAIAVCEQSKQKAAAADFISFVNSAEGRVLMKKSGFLLPGEAVTAK